MRVYLVRHAEAAPGEPDEFRPLTAAGKRAARELGGRIAADGKLDAVVTSPLLRARETGAVIARETGVAAATVAEGLAPGATSESLLAAVAGRGARVVAVAHQPDCSQIAGALTGSEVPFAPGDMLAIELELEPAV